MRRQRNMAQMKKEHKISHKGATKMETSNLLDAEVKTVVIKMFSELKGKVDKLRENFISKKKGIKTIKQNQ